MAASAASRVATRLTAGGWVGCQYFQKARTALQGLAVLAPPGEIAVDFVEHPDRASFVDWWTKFRTTLGPRAEAHSSSPAVWLNGSDFLGGCDSTLAWIKANYMAGSSISRPPRVVHDNDARTSDDGTGYDFDVVVIGGGSGGLAFSKEAAALGARTCVLDFVKPSWAGTSWGLGGTCVNVGCIPKKLMHTAALLGETLHDAEAYGWEGAGIRSATHSWEKLRSAVQDHVSGLNFGYRVALREAGIDYKNALGTFVDAHTVECTDKKGKKVKVTARRVVVAVGGRPKALECPGGEVRCHRPLALYGCCMLHAWRSARREHLSSSSHVKCNRVSTSPTASATVILIPSHSPGRSSPFRRTTSSRSSVRLAKRSSSAPATSRLSARAFSGASAMT